MLGGIELGSIDSIDVLKLDEELCNKFRATVMDSGKFRAICSELDGRNKMNVIYSSMDWLNVAVEGTRTVDFELKGRGYNHQNTLKLTQYIISVDLVLESIRQIYRVAKRVFSLEYPFENTSHIFGQNSLSDEDYFKHLRAIFGIHPVNLKSINGVEEKRSPNRYFASWVSYDCLGEDDFEVSIYGNAISDDEMNSIGINLLKINRFVRERYDLLNNLIQAIRSLVTTEVEKFKGQNITLKGRDTLEDLNILLNENNKRFQYYIGYKFLLQYMINCFECIDKFDGITFDRTTLENYLKRLETLIPKIKFNLENMEFKNIHIGVNARGYEFEKIAQYLYYQQNEVGEEYFKGLVKHSDLPEEFNTIEDFELYRLVYDAYLYSKMDSKKYILYKELLHDESVYISNGSVGVTGYRV